jgi:DNA mismatch repair protein MutL
MPSIRVLSDRVANQIAAGEVIERPAAVIKELVENALDARATRVEVEFSHGGRSYMRVEDNGIGMSADDAQLAIQRHATSKIAEADDLNHLATFGFRGEALPSIASVSRFLLQTKTADAEAGVEVLINGGKPVHVRECGKPTGTRIEVSQLFNSVPARRKFLKTDQTEAAHIIQCVRLYALAFPEVAFVLIEDGRIIFQSPKNTTFLERVSGIFGKQISEGLIPLDAAEPGMRIYGLIGMPGQGRASRHEMISFINQRPVDSRTLNYALIESYHESLPKGRYPVAFVFLEISPAEVDVNVHPAKREVRFRSEPMVRSFVIRSILARLRELVPPANTAMLLPEQQRASQATNAVAIPAPRPLTGFTPPPVARSSETISPGEIASSPTKIEPAKFAISSPEPKTASTWPDRMITLPPSPPVSAPSISGNESVIGAHRHWRFLGVAHKQYALFETPSGLGLLDRRAAHERVLYERLQTSYAKGEVPSQRLLLPVNLELDAIASALVIDAREFLNQHGFEVEEFGRNFFRLEAIPDWMEPGHAETFIRDLLGLLREGQLHAKDTERARDELARFASARGIRISETTNEAELRALLAQLFACRSPLVSPSGRPTYVELSQGELGRRFGR